MQPMLGFCSDNHEALWRIYKLCCFRCSNAPRILHSGQIQAIGGKFGSNSVIVLSQLLWIALQRAQRSPGTGPGNGLQQEGLYVAVRWQVAGFMQLEHLI